MIRILLSMQKTQIPGLGRSLGGGNGNPFQYSAWKIPDRGAWWATVHGVAKESDLAPTHTICSKYTEEEKRI